MKTQTMTNTTIRRERGFTMVELLIAIIIIGILVAIIVPVLSNRASDARIAAAQADLEAIANAESQIALDTGYVVRLHVIDDSGAVGDNIGSHLFNDVIDSIRDEEFNATGNSDLIFLDAKTGVILPNNLYVRAQANPDAFGWRGPYANFQKKLKPTNPITPFPPGFDWTYGSPIDPWGNPYFLFVAGESGSGGGPAIGGWMNEVTGTIDTNFTYGGVTVTATQFDRLTLLSLGPDGVPGSISNPILGTGDDIVRAF